MPEDAVRLATAAPARLTLAGSRPLTPSPRHPLIPSPPHPFIRYLGEDRETKGNWIGNYGQYAWILCGMSAPRDMVGGVAKPLKCHHDDLSKTYANETIWVRGKDELRYTAWTGNPRDVLVRHWIGVHRTDDVRALENPQWGERTWACWDDHGELRPTDGWGPDLYVKLRLPPGSWRVGLYFVDWDWAGTPFPRAQRLALVGEGGRELCTVRLAGLEGGAYKLFSVGGGSDTVLRLRKDQSVAVTLAGVFVDPLPLSPNDLRDRERAGEATARLLPPAQAAGAYERLAAEFRSTHPRFAGACMRRALEAAERRGAGREMAYLRGAAKRLKVLADRDWAEGRGLVRVPYALPAAAYRRLAERIGPSGLAAEEKRAWAECMSRQTWYLLGWRELAATQEALMPPGRPEDAPPEVVADLLRSYALLAQSDPAYASKAEDLGRSVLERVATRAPVSPGQAQIASVLAGMHYQAARREATRKWCAWLAGHCPRAPQAARARAILEAMQR